MSIQHSPNSTHIPTVTITPTASEILTQVNASRHDKSEKHCALTFTVGNRDFVFHVSINGHNVKNAKFSPESHEAVSKFLAPKTIMGIEHKVSQLTQRLLT